jgi:hypothetical protein
MLAVLLEEAAQEGIEDSDRFDWLVERSQQLDTHVQSEGTDQEFTLRPEFSLLFEKFRIGKTTVTYTDPSTGSPFSRKILNCTLCHSTSGEDENDQTSLALNVLTRIRTLSATTASAERILLKARRGGVQTREALLKIDEAIDTQIELQVLLHSFSFEEDSPFGEKYKEGLQLAREAVKAGEEALGELEFRRKGLLLSLGFIGLVLVGLALKIRQLG